MDWLNEPWFEVPVFVTVAVAASVALKKFWEHIVKPGWSLMKSAVHLAEIHETVNASLPILKEMNEQFQPNSGTSIHDRITSLRRPQILDRPAHREHPARRAAGKRPEVKPSKEKEKPDGRNH